MRWEYITSTPEFEKAKDASAGELSVIFKHSTQCGLSASAKDRLEAATFPEEVRFYMVKVIEDRSVSNAIEKETGIRHESPQLFIYKDGKLVHNSSHRAIGPDKILDLV